VIATRRNARFDAANVLLRGGYAPAERFGATAQAEYFRRGQGVPGSIRTPSETARYASERTAFAGTARTGNGAAWPAAEARAHFARTHSGLRDIPGLLGLGRLDTNDRFDDGGGDCELTSPVAWRGIRLSAGVSLRAENARTSPPTLGLADPPPSARHTRAAWITADVRTPGDRLLLHASRRWDRQRESIRDRLSTGALRAQDAERTLNAPQLGARLGVLRGFELRANWSRSARAPELDELFGVDGSITGNPTLRPERAENWDAGCTWSGAVGPVRVSGDWSHHASHARDLILYERSTVRGVRPTNVDAARIFGEETALHAAWRAAELTASTAWLSATDRSPISFYHGRRLPQRPAREAFARLDWQGTRWLAAADIEYLGDTYLNRANLARAPSRTLVGASLGRRLGDLSAVLEGRNLGNRLAEDVAGFPLPGRMILFSLTFDRSEAHDSH